ncbi:hypothetical protein FBY06_11457 [Pseudomonas sp. SJZ085]|uniref:hypothetical protein n=1 Tax=unclassified Pseudomonas TaxID=196821 RepID=UPI00119A40B6|nr:MULTISPECIES: hypothetical protein [unclassified Pseudomonas]TWC18602.1 hypothetical protein FBX99_11457 [Pseudomonas sp. SJZ074]TWC36385.1 hypothetical protein FBY06_11457 [Pseudomonas sp. SJZ085]
MGALSLMEAASPVPPLSILTEAFLAQLSAFNALTREIRDAGIAIRLLVFLDNKIFIELDGVELFMRWFGAQLQGVRYSPEGPMTCNTVTVRGVDVAWFTSAKEQDQ